MRVYNTWRASRQKAAGFTLSQPHSLGQFLSVNGGMVGLTCLCPSGCTSGPATYLWPTNSRKWRQYGIHLTTLLRETNFCYKFNWDQREHILTLHINMSPSGVLQYVLIAQEIGRSSWEWLHLHEAFLYFSCQAHWPEVATWECVTTSDPGPSLAPGLMTWSLIKANFSLRHIKAGSTCCGPDPSPASLYRFQTQPHRAI